MLVAICIRIKDEDIILPEFVAHNINLGFDRIHIYDNNDQLLPYILFSLFHHYYY